MHRVTLLTTGLALGGAEGQVVLLAKTLKRRGWKVEVVSMLRPEAWSDDLQDTDIPLHVLGMRRGIPDPRAVLWLHGHLKRFKPHVVHCHMIHANILGRITRLLSRTPVLISTAHSVDEGGGWRNWAYRLTDSLSDVTSNVSLHGKERYVDRRLIGTERAVWVPNGIDVNCYSYSEDTRSRLREELGWEGYFMWIAVGNLREPKDYPNLIRAFQEVHSDNPKSRLAIVGAGPLEVALQKTAAEAGLSDCLKFMGRRQDVPRLLQAADAYVMSSAWEGMPMAVLEAGASELPIVSTEVGGVSEVIDAGTTGLLVPPRSPSALAHAMSKVAAMTQQERKRMGYLARHRIERLFGHDTIVNRWENIYRQLLEHYYSSRHRRAHSARPTV